MEITREELERWKHALTHIKDDDVGAYPDAREFMLRMIDQLLRLQDWKDIYAPKSE